MLYPIHMYVVDLFILISRALSFFSHSSLLGLEKCLRQIVFIDFRWTLQRINSFKNDFAIFYFSSTLFYRPFLIVSVFFLINREKTQQKKFHFKIPTKIAERTS